MTWHGARPDQFAVGSDFVEKAFLSTSLIRGVYDQGKDPIQWTIHNVKDNARSMQGVSALSGEAEVLMPPNQHLTIKAITRISRSGGPSQKIDSIAGFYKTANASEKKHDDADFRWEIEADHAGGPDAPEKKQ